MQEKCGGRRIVLDKEYAKGIQTPSYLLNLHYFFKNIVCSWDLLVTVLSIEVLDGLFSQLLIEQQTGEDECGRSRFRLEAVHVVAHKYSSRKIS